LTNKVTGYVNPYKTITVKLPNGKFKRLQVSRLVCQAFHPIPHPETMQVDHKNNDPTDNKSSNLQWVSRKANNSKKHTRQMKSLNAKHTNHKDEFIRAENIETGEVRYFKNGRTAATALGCSHVLIYNVIAGKFANSAKGWKVSWVPRTDEGAKEFADELEMARIEKLNAIQEAKEQVRKARKELRRLMKLKQKELLKRQAEAMRNELQQAKVQQEKERKEKLWERHVVLQFTMDGELVKEWKSAAEAIRETGITTIHNCLKGFQEDAGGYVWKHKIENND